MKKFKSLILTILFFSAVLLSSVAAYSETTASDIVLPAPTITGGMPLMDALKNRKSSIKFSKEPIPLQTLSNLLWAADGVNRSDGKRTAPSALNAQVVTIYAAFPDGIYKYNPQTHTLSAFSKEDVRPIVGKYPMVLLYVANLTRQSKYLASVDIGFIGQNVYLFCAANDLNTIFLYDSNSYALNNKLELKLGEEVLFAQAVGYPTGK